MSGTPFTTDVPVTLREAEPDDRTFLIALYASTRAEEFAEYGWPVEMERQFVQAQFDAQRVDYDRRHPGARCYVVELRRCPIGRLWVARDARSVTILDISLIPDLRGYGIGTACLREVLREATAARQDVELQVVVGNRAQALYERLGFRKVGDAGVRQAMAWTPPVHPNRPGPPGRRAGVPHEQT